MTRTFLALALFFATVVGTTDAPMSPLPAGRPPILPLSGEPTYLVNFDDVLLKDVVDEVTKLTDLMFLSKECPDVRITIRNRVPIGQVELFAQLEDALNPHGYVVLVKKQSFSVCPEEALWHHGGGYRDMVSLNELRKRHPREVYKMVLDVDPNGGVEEAERIAKRLDGVFEVSAFGAGKVMVRGRVGDLRKFVDEMGDRIKR